MATTKVVASLGTSLLPSTTDVGSILGPRGWHNESGDGSPTDAGLGISSPIVSSTLVIGACLAIGGNLLISISMNIQKYSLTKIQQRRDAQGQDSIGNYEYLTSWVWWMGIGVMILGECGNFIAYAFGPASVIAPLGTTTVVANAYISRCLGERLRCQDILGTVIIVIGAFMIVIFSTQHEARLTAHLIVQRLISWPFLVFIILEVMLFTFLLYLRHIRGYKHLLLFLLPGALLASLTVLGAKASSSLIAGAVQGEISEVRHPIFYIMLLLVLITGVLQIRYVTRTMQEYDASVVVPVYFVFFTLSAILIGVFFYGEFTGLTVVRIFMFVFGCICSFIGVFMITQGRETSDEEKEEERTRKDRIPPSETGENFTGESPLLPPPTTLHLVQPAMDGDQGGAASSTDSGDGPEYEMEDMSNTFRDSPKWPLLDKTIVRPQIGTEHDMNLNQRKPQRNTSPSIGNDY